jgi:hypothetical protein
MQIREHMLTGLDHTHDIPLHAFNTQSINSPFISGQKEQYVAWKKW